jgi:hypothetical protein
MIGPCSRKEHVMLSPMKSLSIILPACILASCGVDTTPGRLPDDAQADYKETPQLSCVAMNGRSYVISLVNGPPATDTVVFASDQMEAVGGIGTGFNPSPYACSGTDSLLITAEMHGDTSRVLRWSATLVGEEIHGNIMRADTTDQGTAFTGHAIPGVNATLRTPQRQVERL